MRKNFGLVLMITGVASLAVVVIYSFTHPDLTEMRIFLDKWYLILGGIFLIAVGGLIHREDRSHS
jgi:hypothetical protein